MSITSIPREHSSIWWVFLLQGVAGILLGLMLLTDPGATLVVLATFLGFYWFFIGTMALIRAFVDRVVPWIWSLLTGIIGISAGLLVLRHPMFAALTVPTIIVVVLGVQGLIMGVSDIIGAFRGGGLGSFLLGAINVVIGLVLLGSPLTAALAVPVVFGVLLLVQGVGLVVLAFRIRAA
jgi:uncharacterized membrane protein HdeD (DUF308 family)